MALFASAVIYALLAPNPRLSHERLSLTLRVVFVCVGGAAGADDEPMLKVAVFGAGAVGGLIGAHLARQIQQGVGRVQLTLFARGGAAA
eukprot:COSAG04_NODE_323_length_16882_cov_5.975627_17_plen_89_part_00